MEKIREVKTYRKWGGVSIKEVVIKGQLPRKKCRDAQNVLNQNHSRTNVIFKRTLYPVIFPSDTETL